MLILNMFVIVLTVTHLVTITGRQKDVVSSTFLLSDITQADLILVVLDFLFVCDGPIRKIVTIHISIQMLRCCGLI